MDHIFYPLAPREVARRERSPTQKRYIYPVSSALTDFAPEFPSLARYIQAR
jgi:hypothetical protein